MQLLLHSFRPVGSDIALGEQVLECGVLLSPSKIGLAAAVGVDKVGQQVTDSQVIV